MQFSLTDLGQLAALPADTVIDVRSPAEFAEDHLPGAVNLPALSDAERARVGTIYVREDRFRARRIGAALVARNVAAHLEGPLADRDGGWRPFVYCWRGGQRSGAVAAILQQIGWRATVLDGGYRSYRRLVVSLLHDRPLAVRPVLLDGDTGTAKTRVLALLAESGWQVLDLEALANHRGSALGDCPGGQPSQKLFEGRLARRLAAMDPARPLVVEAESSRIGTLNLPPALWSAMKAAPRVALTAPVTERARYLARAYAGIAGDGPALAAGLDRLRHLQGHATVEAWQEMARAGALEDLAAALMRAHYDPRYARARARHRPPAASVAVPDLSESGLARALPGIAAALDRAALSADGSPGGPR